MTTTRIHRPVLPKPVVFPPPPNRLKIGGKPIGHDPVQLRSAAVRGDLLQLTLSHPGGAKAHTFQVAWGGNFQETFPVQTALDLSHNAHGDRAEAMVTEKVSVDLTPLRDAYRKLYRTEHGTIRFSVAGRGLEYGF